MLSYSQIDVINMQQASKLAIFRKIPATVWAMGFVGLIDKISSVMVFNISPIYLTEVLGVSMLGVGMIETVVEFISWMMRIFSGVASDYLHKRKPVLLTAYGVIAASRFIFPLAPNATYIFLAKFVDRIGNGFQAAPREALIGDIAPPDLKGSSYGLLKTLMMLGSTLGGVLLLVILHTTGNDYVFAFWVAAISPVLAIVILVLFVKDKPTIAVTKTGKKKIFHLAHIKNLSRQYWVVVAVASMFMVSNYSGAFMILQAKGAGITESFIPIVMVLQNVAAFLSAFPAGWLSDKIGRNKLLMLGFAIVILSNSLLAMTNAIVFVLAGVILWGMQMGITQSLLSAKIADNAPEDVRGSAFGIYYVCNAVALLIGNVAAGHISHSYSLEWVFHASSGVALLALVGLFVIKDNK